MEASVWMSGLSFCVQTLGLLAVVFSRLVPQGRFHLWSQALFVVVLMLVGSFVLSDLLRGNGQWVFPGMTLSLMMLGSIIHVGPLEAQRI